MSLEHERDLDEHTIRVRLEILPGDISEEDLALTNELRQDTFLTVNNLGTIVPTGEEKVIIRGGPAPIDILMAIQGAATFVSIHRDTFEQVLHDAADLVAICAGVAPLVKGLFDSHKKRASPESGPLKVTVTFKQDKIASISVEAKDVEGEEAGLKLAQKVYQQYPTQASLISTRSGVSVTAQVPKQPRRKRGRH
jgi:hypothetical protein